MIEIAKLPALSTLVLFVSNKIAHINLVILDLFSIAPGDVLIWTTITYTVMRMIHLSVNWKKKQKPDSE